MQWKLRGGVGASRRAEEGVPTQPGGWGLPLTVSSIQVKCLGSRARLPGMNSSPAVYYDVTLCKFLNFSVPQFPHL